jgi:V/A-type H+/Na+-transporting ATPase subunit D
VSRTGASKHELKRQRDALARFQRYLPTLRLKQRQLQVELRRIEVAVQEASEDEARVRRDLDAWIEVWSEGLTVEPFLRIEEIVIGETSVAGVSIPTLDEIVWRRSAPPPDTTPPWVDDAVAALERLAEAQLRRRVLAEGRSRLADELRLTGQRVNLFEKVKIPAAEEALRTIRIALGDLQAAEVVRAKIAKAKTLEREAAT